jgi:hypothetical protein
MVPSLLVIGVALLVGAPPTSAAAPHVIIVYSAQLPGPIVMDDWSKNLEFLLDLDESTEVAATFDSHVVLDIEMYWGPAVEEYLAKGGSPLDLRSVVQPDPARLFLPRGKGVSALAWAGRMRSIGPAAMAVLDSNGIPSAVGLRPFTPPSTGNSGLR